MLKDGTRPVQCVRAVLSKWRMFWGSPPGNWPTAEEEIRGLFGELWSILV